MTSALARDSMTLVIASLGVCMAGAGLAAAGIAPIAATLVSDLVGHNERAALIAILFAGLGGAQGILTFEVIRAQLRRADVKKKYLRNTLNRGILAILITLSTMHFLSVDSDNLFSWRQAETLLASNGVTKHRFDKDGMQFVRLSLLSYDAKSSEVAKVPVPWDLRMAEGQFKVVARLGAIKKEGVLRHCDGRSVSPIEVQYEEAQIEIAISDTCGAWITRTIEVVPGISSIVIAVSDPSQDYDGLEMGFIEKRVNPNAILSITTVVAWSAVIFSIWMVLGVCRSAGADYPDNAKAVGRMKRHPLAQVWRITAIGLFLVLANYGVYSFVNKEQTIYAWDFGGHWMNAVRVSNALTGGDNNAEEEANTFTRTGKNQFVDKETAPQAFDQPTSLQILLRNIRYAEYNVASAIPVAIPMSLLGSDRLVYELSLVNVYALAALLSILVFLWHYSQKRDRIWPAYWPLVAVLILLCFNPFWVPLVRGYIGISVVALNIIVLWLYFRRPPREQNVLSLLLIGTILAISVVFRRWNAYWVVGFFVIAGLDAIRVLLTSKGDILLRMQYAFRPIILVGFVAASTIAVIAWPLVVTIVTTDYSDIFSAYADESSGVIGHLRHFVRIYGIGLILLVTASTAYLLLRTEYRWLAALLSIQVLFVATHISFTQIMGIHHMYILMPNMILLCSLAAAQGLGIEVGKGRAIVVSAVALFALNGTLSHAAVFSPRSDVIRNSLVPIVPENYRPPLQRSDLQEFEKLVEYLDAETEKSASGSSIYVLSSSDVFAAAQLKMFELSTGRPFRSVDRVLRTAEVDKRDGFPRGVIDADLILVASPIQYNVSPGDQKVITIPAEMLLNNSDVGKAFQRQAYEFRLNEDVRVFVFRRQRRNSDAEIARLSEELRIHYPDRPFVYEY